jgi:phage FluMu protein Com
VVLLGAAIIGRLLNTKISLVGTMALALVAVIGLVSEIGFSLVVEKVLKVKVQVSRPPIIMGRIIADGTGAAYLREKCPQAGFVVCKFVDRLKSNSDAFLWERDGVYRPAQITERKMLGEEQYLFAAAVLAYDPVGQITATLSDGVQQLRAMGLSDFIDGADQAFAQLPPFMPSR